MSAADVDLGTRPDDGRRTTAWRAVAGTVEGAIGIAVTVVMLAVVAVGPFLAPYDPEQTAVGAPAQGPSAEHLLGTDSLGRDVLSRVLTGGNTMLLIAFVGVTLAFLLGGSIAMLGSYRGGALDATVIRGFDFLVALPSLLVILVIVGALGSSTIVLTLTICFVYTPLVGRTVRGAAQAVMKNDYIAAAQARGERTHAILIREALPNMAAPVIADYSLRLTYAIITVATLSFLGLGVQPPTPDWGLMVSESRSIITLQPYAVLAPVVAIALLSVGLNLVADSLTRHLTHERTQEVIPL